MSAASAFVTYRFGEIEVDAAAYEVRRGGRRLTLARQPMDLLLLLLERRQELVSREEIAKRLWRPEVFTDVDAGIRTAILRIRQALGDSRESPRFVETVPGKGYRFVAPVEVVAPSLLQSPPRLGAPYPPDRLRHNLPAELTSFIGRRKELRELPAVLGSSRLLTLTGAGGVGKTRLAVRLARDLVNHFRDGVWVVDLAPLSAPSLVAQTIVTVLGVREGPKRSARDILLDTLRDRELLLVIDNCEHLIAACAELVETLLRGAPALRILATSREALGVSGETVWRVPSLSLPEAGASVRADALVESEATQLFIERATAVEPGFTPTADNADAIARLCRRLDGIPLAIELAAARTVVLSPQQIETRLHDRFRLLTGGSRTAIARHRTLEATVDWSYELLSDVERQLLQRLSVFPASWTLEAAEHVCGSDGINEHDVLDLLSRLASKSLVVIDSDGAGEHRYRFLETVRQYARERLAQSGAARRLRERHFDFFFNEFRGARPILQGHGQLELLKRLRSEQENVRAALECALTSPPLAEKGVELAGALFWFWTKRSQFEEGSLWLERALAVRVDPPGSLRASALLGLANVSYFRGIDARDHLAEALSLGRAAGDPWVMSHALFLQALAALERGDYDRAVACALEARAAADAGGGDVDHAGPLFVLGHVAMLTGDTERALALYDESIEVSRRNGESWGLGILLLAAAAMRIIRDDHVQGRTQASEALSLFQELEDPRGIAWSLEVFAGLLAAGGEPEGAARLWAASEELLESIGASVAPNIRLIRDRYLEAVKTSMGEARFAVASAEGRAMPLTQVIALSRHQESRQG